MVVRLAALSALLASGLAAGQSGGIVLTSGSAGSIATTGNGSFGFIQSTTLNQGDFQQIFTESGNRVFIIADFSSMIGEALRQNDQREVPLMVDAVRLEGEAVLLDVEGDGVRLPDQRLDTIKR